MHKSIKSPVRHKCLINQKVCLLNPLFRNKVVSYVIRLHSLAVLVRFSSKMSSRSYFCSLNPRPQSVTKVRFYFVGCQHFRITFFKINRNILIFKTIKTNFFLLSSVKTSVHKNHLDTHTFHDAFNFISG